ncbi:carboxy-terminal kinesin 2 [Pyricularia oryzae]|nr:carboxy-terminal kinesin 2 [Pyricularia oryzae]
MKSSCTGGSGTGRCSNGAEPIPSFPFTRLFPHLHHPSGFTVLHYVSSVTTTPSPIASGALLLASNFALQRELIPRFRSLSMDGSVENAVQRPSGLRPPTRIGALNDISESQNNARAKNTMLPLAGHSNLKRQTKDDSLPQQPESKQRKTLAERAAEFGVKSNVAATPAPRHVKASSIASLAANRLPSATPAVNRQPTRNNFGTSVGPGARPPSAAGRSQTFARSVNGGPRGTVRPRPATAFGSYAAVDEDDPPRQNGTKHCALNSTKTSSTASPRRKRLRGAQSLQSLAGTHAPKRMRESSLTFLAKGIQNLSLHDMGDSLLSAKTVSTDGKVDQAVSNYQGTDPARLEPLNEALPESVTLRSKTNNPGGRGNVGESPLPALPGPQKDAAESSAMPPPPPMTPRPTGKTELEVLSARFSRSISKLKEDCFLTSSPSKSRAPFLTKDSNIRAYTGWDVDERLQKVESQWQEMQSVMKETVSEKKSMEHEIESANKRANALENELLGLRQQVQTLTLDLESERRTHKYDLEDKIREHRNELDNLRRQLRDEVERAERGEREAREAAERQKEQFAIEQARMAEDREQMRVMGRALQEKDTEIDSLRAMFERLRIDLDREREDMRAQLGSKEQEAGRLLREKERENDDMRSQVERLKGDLDREMTLKEGVQRAAVEMQTANLGLEAQIQQLQGKIRFLESSNQQQADSYTEMESKLQEALQAADEAKQKLIKEETERRVLFNKYQELKGNIRVMCRVRPVLDRSEGEEAGLAFPDSKTSAQIDVQTEERSATGTVTRRVMPFEFDRVFAPNVQNEEVFGEISQLVQSALDGFNVCIFCYGQTGSGKTYTMSSPDGMIPRATNMIYETIEQLKQKSWTYTMEGSFVEVYNEELHDLLASERERRKLTIQHDEVRKQTTVVNCKTVHLDRPEKVETMLRQAQGNRSVAATKANERSSRSHSVFMLKLVGTNSATGERCEGTLNLVDLAGSERLKHSQAEGDRMRETQSINKSLSCLGDVIEALGRKGSSSPGAHVPYRNSKLTHLLQFSLGGNSKTLMFVMVSPLEAHLKETVTSLRFATKVHNTHIGTAKSTKKLTQ